MTTTRDPRISPIEDNLLAVFAFIDELPQFGTDGHADVATYHHPTAFPLLNLVSGATFLDGDREAVRRRAAAVNAPYFARGLPFMWWTTPSTTSPALDEYLRDEGFHVEEVPGMHAPLAGTAAGPVPEGLTISLVDADNRGAFRDALLTGFEMPDELAGPFLELFESMDPVQWVDLVGTVDGRTVAGGSVWITGTTAGLFNIFTAADARGRGYGTALTAALMELALGRGCTEAILHATEDGYPVYERMGFREVCRVDQYVWVPVD